MLVQSWMSKKVVTVPGSYTLLEAEQLLEENGLRRVPVVDERRVIGILCDTDILKAKPSILDPGDTELEIERFSQLLVENVMTDNPQTVSLDATLEKALQIMRRHKINSIPVLKDGEIEGIITETNIYNAFLTVLGAGIGGTQLDLVIEQGPSSFYSMMDIFRQQQMEILAIVLQTEYSEGCAKVTIRTRGDNLETLVDNLWKKGIKVDKLS